MSPRQMRLWPRRYPWTPAIDLAAKIVQEARDGVQNRAHFEAR